MDTPPPSAGIAADDARLLPPVPGVVADFPLWYIYGTKPVDDLEFKRCDWGKTIIDCHFMSARGHNHTRKGLGA